MRIGYSCLLIVLATVVLCHSADAQTLRGYGLNVGISSAGISGFPLADPHLDRRTGWYVSARAEWLDLPFVSLITEVGYVQRGFVEKHEERDVNGEFVQDVRAATRLAYVTVPVLGKVRYTGSLLSPYLVAGPRIDLLVSREAGVAEFTSSTFRSDWTDHYSSTATGGTVGLGVVVGGRSSPAFLVEARYNFDLTDSTKDISRETYNNAIDFVIGIRLQ